MVPVTDGAHVTNVSYLEPV